MTVALFFKELRHLFPVAVLMVTLVGLHLISIPFETRLDELTWADMVGDLAPGQGMASAVGLMVLGLIAAYSLFPREHDEGTIHFLYSLPVSRRQVFGAKIVAAVTILWGGLMFSLVTDGLIQRFNTQSFTGEDFQLSIVLPLLWLHACYTLIILCHGVLLSFLRRFGLFLYALIGLALQILEQRSPSWSTLNVLNVLVLEYEGQILLVPWEELALHLGIAGIALALGYALWSIPAEAATQMYQRLLDRFWGRGLLLAGSLGIVALIVAMFYINQQQLGMMAPPSVSFPKLATARFDTQHYRFVYLAGLRSTAMAVMTEADSAYQTVRSMLGAVETSRIVVDLTERSVEHAGIAGWQKIRMDIQSNQSSKSYLRTLYHETTHVFEATESNRHINDHVESTMFFNEGLAEYVAFKALPDPDQLAAHRLLAAVSWRRQQIQFDHLVDLPRFKAEFNENLFYVLGEFWVQALSDICGEKAPGEVLRAMARDGAPQHLSGRELWQDTLQAIHCDIEAVNSAWEQQMATSLESRASDASHMPRLSGGVTSSQDELIELVAVLDRPVPEDDIAFSIRVRNDRSAREEEVLTYGGSIRPGTTPVEVQFQVPAQDIRGRRFEFQFGYQTGPGFMPYYEPWRSASKP